MNVQNGHVSSNTHEVIPLRTPDMARMVYIDKNLAPLIETLWTKFDITTYFSCEGGAMIQETFHVDGNNMAYVMFKDDEAFKKLLPEIMRFFTSPEAQKAIWLIKFDFFPEGLAEPNLVGPRATIRFPRRSINTLNHFLLKGNS